MKTTNKELIENIDWDKEWEDLPDNDRANFLSLIKQPFYNKLNWAKVTNEYARVRNIYEDRGRDKIELYL